VTQGELSPLLGGRKDSRFERVSEEPVYQGVRYRMHRLTERLPDGKIAERDVLRHPGAAVIVAVDGDGKIVLIEQHRPALGHNLLEIPAGLLEPGEDPQVTARRELIEETGFSPGSVKPLLVLHPAPGFSDEKMYVFLAEELREGEQDLDEGEFVEVHRCTPQQVRELIRSGQITDGKSIAALLWYFTFEMTNGTLVSEEEG